MGLAGWFLMLITGVSSKLIPMFLVSKQQKPVLLSWSFCLVNGGLLFFIIDTYFAGLKTKTNIAASIVLAGIACWLSFIVGCFHSRMRRKFDLSIWHSLVSFLLLGLAIIVLPLIIFNHIKADPRAVDYSLFYGSLLYGMDKFPDFGPNVQDTSFCCVAQVLPASCRQKIDPYAC